MFISEYFMFALLDMLLLKGQKQKVCVHVCVSPTPLQSSSSWHTGASQWREKHGGVYGCLQTPPPGSRPSPADEPATHTCTIWTHTHTVRLQILPCTQPQAQRRTDEVMVLTYLNQKSLSVRNGLWTSSTCRRLPVSCRREANWVNKCGRDLRRRHGRVNGEKTLDRQENMTHD